MRIGTRVQRYNVVATDVATMAEIFEHYGPQGTVIDSTEINHRGHCVLTIRWDSGAIETVNPDAEECPYLLDDVTPRVYCNVYLWDKAYGGAEEGGWWYDTYTPVPEQCRQHATEEQAAQHLETVIAWAQAENAERYEPSSVLSEGHYVARLEAWPAEDIPAQRPQYC